MSVSSSGFATLVDDDFEDYEIDDPTNQSLNLPLNSQLHQFSLDEPTINNQPNHLSVNRFDADHRRASSTANLENVLRQWSEQSSYQSSPSNRSASRRQRQLTSPIRRSFGQSMGLNVQDALSGRASPIEPPADHPNGTNGDNHLTVQTELSDDDVVFGRSVNHPNRFSSSLMRLRSLTKNKSPHSINYSNAHTPSVLSNGRDSPSINQSFSQSAHRSMDQTEELESPFDDEKGIPNFHTEDSKTYDEDESPSIHHAIRQPNTQNTHHSLEPHNPFDEPDEAKTASPTNNIAHHSSNSNINVTPPRESLQMADSLTSSRSNRHADHLSPTPTTKPTVVTKPQPTLTDHQSASPLSHSPSKQSSVKSTPPDSPVMPSRSKTPEPVTSQSSQQAKLSALSPAPSPVTPSNNKSTKPSVTPSTKQSSSHADHSATFPASPAHAQPSLSDMDDQAVKQRFQGKFVGLTRDILMSLQQPNHIQSIGERVEAAAFSLTDCLIKLDVLSTNQSTNPTSPVARSFGAASRRQLVFIPSQSFVDDQSTDPSYTHSPLPLTSETSLASAPRLDIIKAFVQPKPSPQAPRSWLVSELLVGIHESISRADSEPSHLCALFACVSELMARFQTTEKASQPSGNPSITPLFRSFAVPFPTSWAYHPSPLDLSTFVYPTNSSLSISQFLLLELLDARASAFQCVLAQSLNQWQALPDPTSSYDADADGSWLEPYFTTLTEFDSYARHAHWTAFERAQLLGCAMYSLIAHVLSSVMNSPELSMQDGIKLKILASTLQDFAQRLAGDVGVQAMESAGLAGLRDLGLLLLLEKSDIDLNMVQTIAPSLDLLTIHRICFTFMQTEGNEPVSPELLAQISQALASLDEDELKKALPTEPQCLLLIGWNGGHDRQVADQVKSTEFDAIFQQHPEFKLVRR